MVKTKLSKKTIQALSDEADYYNEEGDLQAAFHLGAKLAKAGHASSQLRLANFYSEGLWVKKDVQKELYWLYKAADQKDNTAANNIGMVYRMQGKYAQAMAWIALAGAGYREYRDGDALCWAGEVLLEKLGDMECAKQYLLLAKKSDEFGSITEDGLEKAEELLRRIRSARKASRYMAKKSLSKKATEAIFSEAWRHWGKGELQPAFCLFTKLAKAGSVGSQLNLAHFYGDGLRVKKDPQKELYWLYKAANQKYSPAASYIGAIYRRKKKYAQAIAWLALAAVGYGEYEYGNGDAFCDIGEIMLEKFGDMGCARQYLLLAREAGKSGLICNLEKTEGLLRKIRSSRGAGIQKKVAN